MKLFNIIAFILYLIIGAIACIPMAIVAYFKSIPIMWERLSSELKKEDGD